MELLSFTAARAQTHEVGTATEVRHPVIIVQGLPGATLHERVVFESGQAGFVTRLQGNLIEVLLLSREPVRPGASVARTASPVTVEVGDYLRGQIIDPTGNVVDVSTGAKTTHGQTETKKIDSLPATIEARLKITRQLTTGMSLVDLLLPVSHGQRSAIIGDQKTGKTTFLLSVLKTQAEQNTMVVIAAIGRPWNDIQRFVRFLQQTNQQNVVIVASHSHDTASLIYLTPFTAFTVAEYFRDQGRDVVVALDDITTHAQFYREVSLLGRRFPGRESYPGDMFYTHARLLERAGSFKHPTKGEAAITCLALADTVQSSLTSTIISNLISMTDGHLLFDPTIFNTGRLPAIDTSLSITRVGRQVQSPVARTLNRELTALIAQHSRASRFSHFGAELNQDMRRMLSHGEQVLSFFSQEPNTAVPFPVQLIFAAMIHAGWLEEVSAADVTSWRTCLLERYQTEPGTKALLEQLSSLQDTTAFSAALTQQKSNLMGICQPHVHTPAHPQN